MVGITWEAKEETEKMFRGNEHYGWKYTAQILFTGLTMEDRRLMKLRTEKSNPDYDPKKKIDEKKDLIKFIFLK